MGLAMLSLPPEIGHQIVEVLPDKPNYRERGQGENAALNDECLGICHDCHFCSIGGKRPYIEVVVV